MKFFEIEIRFNGNAFELTLAWFLGPGFGTRQSMRKPTHRSTISMSLSSIDLGGRGSQSSLEYRIWNLVYLKLFAIPSAFRLTTYFLRFFIFEHCFLHCQRSNYSLGHWRCDCTVQYRTTNSLVYCSLDFYCALPMQCNTVSVLGKSRDTRNKV